MIPKEAQIRMGASALEAESEGSSLTVWADAETVLTPVLTDIEEKLLALISVREFDSSTASLLERKAYRHALAIVRGDIS